MPPLACCRCIFILLLIIKTLIHCQRATLPAPAYSTTIYCIVGCPYQEVLGIFLFKGLDVHGEKNFTVQKPYVIQLHIPEVSLLNIFLKINGTPIMQFCRYIMEQVHRKASITPVSKTCAILEQKWGNEIHRQQTKSSHPAHDVVLVEIGERARKMSLVEKYVQENILQCCPDLFPSPRYEAFSRVHSDAGLKIVIKEKSFYLALEYEAILKSKARIKDKLFEYSLRDEIRAILYICKDAQIEKSLRKMEKEFWTGPKFSLSSPLTSFSRVLNQERWVCLRLFGQNDYLPSTSCYYRLK